MGTRTWNEAKKIVWDVRSALNQRNSTKFLLKQQRLAAILELASYYFIFIALASCYFIFIVMASCYCQNKIAARQDDVFERNFVDFPVQPNPPNGIWDKVHCSMF